MVPWLIGKVSQALDVETAINMVIMGTLIPIEFQLTVTHYCHFYIPTDLLKEAVNDNTNNILDPRRNSTADRAEDAASMASEVANLVIRTPTLEDL